MVNIKKTLFFVLVIFSMISLVSGFSFADLFDVNLLTGKIVNNKNPSVSLGMPSDGQVVGNPVTFSWIYFDPEDDKLESYTILIDDNQRFTSPIAYYGLVGDSQKVYLSLEDGQYYWRIEVNNKFGSETSDFRGFYLNTKEKLCEDGTMYYDCSVNKPDYCRAGVLVKDCIRCGCDRGATCGKGGNCIEQKCVDGTIYGECSINKPKYCLSSGILKDTCSLCGCPVDLVCDVDGKCKEKSTEIIEEKPTETEIKETGITGFFKRIAGVFRFIFKGEPL